MSQVSVAVVIVNYNSGALLRRCLLHLDNQTLSPDAIVVVDNNSDDEESENVFAQVSGLTIIRSPRNVGFAAAANLGARAVRDMDYVAMLNPDAFASRSWLEKLVHAGERYPGHGSFASLMLMDHDDSVIDGAGDELHITGLPSRRFHGRQLSSVRPRESNCFSACAGAALYRSSAFHSVGGFDERFFMYVEDVDLGFRLQLAGYPCLLVPDAAVCHIGSAIAGKDSDLALYFGHRNLVWCYVKNCPLPVLLLTWPLHLVMTMFVVCYYAFRGRGAVLVKAKVDALKQLCSFWRSRRERRQAVSTQHVWRMLEKRLVRQRASS